jgi:hypothetical protein
MQENRRLAGGALILAASFAAVAFNRMAAFVAAGLFFLVAIWLWLPDGIRIRVLPPSRLPPASRWALEEALSRQTWGRSRYRVEPVYNADEDALYLQVSDAGPPISPRDGSYRSSPRGRGRKNLRRSQVIVGRLVPPAGQRSKNVRMWRVVWSISTPVMPSLVGTATGRIRASNVRLSRVGPPSAPCALTGLPPATGGGGPTPC